MSEVTMQKKERILMTLFLSVLMIGSVIAGFPIGFPEESQLQYSTGVFEVKNVSRTVDHVLLKQVDSNDYQVFACSYNPFANGNSSSCRDLANLTPYIDKEVTIGWYKVDKFLGFTNDMPQLVTMVTDGEVMQTYTQTARYVSQSRRNSLYIYFPMLFPSILFLYLFLGALRTAPRSLETKDSKKL